ncbi:hypothetical protein Q5O14_15895 [Eubacteriaceae bacterium ES2]|nr:hypothetical protein Q5O14_15895 [Eubacteriaceae bacterium ES2]
MTKKLMAALSVLMLVGTAGTVMAAPRDGSGVCDGSGLGIGNDGVAQYQYDSRYDENFVDEDGDGVCDNEPQYLGYHRGQQ